jgi:hypothetical protein
MTRQLVSAAINVPRDQHVIFNPVSGLYEPSLLLEGASTNLCLQAENFAVTWTPFGTPTLTSAAIAASVMGVALDLVGDDDAATLNEGYLQAITFTGDGVKSVSVFMKKGSSPAPNGNDFLLFDNTASVARVWATITWSAGGVPTVVMTNGTHLGTPIAYTNGIYRFRFSSTTVTAANANRIQVYGARNGTPTEVGNVYVGGVQAENTVIPTSYIKTTTATVARQSEVCSGIATLAPQEITVYAKIIELGMCLANGGRVFTIGNAAATTSFLINTSANKYQVFHHNGTSSVNRIAAAQPAYGDQVELRAVLGADGSVLLGQSISGAAEVVTPVSIANALPPAWAAGGLSLGGTPSGTTQLTAFLKSAPGKPGFIILRGTQSLATCRAA